MLGSFILARYWAICLFVWNYSRRGLVYANRLLQKTFNLIWIIFKKCLFVEAARALTDEKSPSKHLRTWLIHIPKLTIIRLKLMSNANCSLDWNSHSMLYGSGFQCKVATPRGSVPSTVRKCAVPTDHLCSEISFSRTSNSPDLTSKTYRIASVTLETLYCLWHIGPMRLYVCAIAWALKQTFAWCTFVWGNTAQMSREPFLEGRE